MRHEAHREEFREEVNKSLAFSTPMALLPEFLPTALLLAYNNIIMPNCFLQRRTSPLPPPVPIYRTSSRLSAADGGVRSSESHFRRTSSQQRNEFRQYNGGTAAIGGTGTENCY
jgi:hypothetical protein